MAKDVKIMYKRYPYYVNVEQRRVYLPGDYTEVTDRKKPHDLDAMVARAIANRTSRAMAIAAKAARAQTQD